MLIKCVLCACERRASGRGLCHRCWERAKRLGMLYAFPRLRWGTWKGRAAYDHARYLRRKELAAGR